MKTIKTTAIAALLSCSLMTPAAAAVNPMAIQIQNAPSLIETSAMRQQCETYAASLNAQYGWQGRSFSATHVDVDNITYSVAWGETPASAVPIESTRVPAIGAMISNASNFSMPAAANLVRTGGSANLFADNVIAHTATFSDTAVDQAETYNGEATYGFHCTPYEIFTVANPGHHVWTGPVQAGGAQAACEAADNNAHETSDQGQCLYIPGVGSTTDERKNVSLSYGYPYNGQGVISAGTLIGTQVANNPHAGSATLNNVNVQVTALVCNNPGPKGGTWRGANGYSGAGCTTIAFNGAPTTSGNTFTILPSNSLPN